MLILSRKTNQKILIGKDIELTIIEVRGEQVKIGINAPQEVEVFRQELYKEIQAENKIATISSSQPSLPNLESIT
ncbi:MAG: carbon storage regulator CsrA [Treponema sp.]